MKQNITNLFQDGKTLVRFKPSPITEFMLDILKMRGYLLRNKRGRMDAKLCAEYGFLRTHIVAYPNRSETGMALFFIRHQEKWRNIIPGKSSASYEGLMRRWAEVEFLSRSILAANAPDYESRD